MHHFNWDTKKTVLLGKQTFVLFFFFNVFISICFCLFVLSHVRDYYKPQGSKLLPCIII